MLLLNIKSALYERFSVGFILNLAFFSFSFLSLANLSSPKIRMLSVCIPTTLNTSFNVVISRHRSYDKVSIPS